LELYSNSNSKSPLKAKPGVNRNPLEKYNMYHNKTRHNYVGGFNLGYIEKNLMEGERVIAKANLHWIVFLGPILWGLLVLLFVIASGSWFVFILALIGFGWAYMLFSSAEFGVTNRRIVAKWGVISRHSVEMNLDKIEGVSVNDGIIGSKLGYGTVIVNGTGGSHEAFPNIANPLVFRKQILEHTTKHLME
jgi:hypothetical protein